jgi:phosphoglycolate phosphatase-like HAD superfamily hydrolase
MKRVYVFDIDGTIANLEHRLHLLPNWDAFFDACDNDAPIDHIIDVARALHQHSDIVYVSGRSDRVRDATVQWLEKHGLPPGRLYMRRAGDHQQDDTLKVELLAELRADGFEPIMAFDDRTRVVKAWRAAGIPCAQVVDGDY